MDLDYSNYHNRAVKKYGAKCMHCSKTEHIEVHHIDGDSQNHNINNLIVLCRSCHRRAHGYKAELSEFLDDLRDELPKESLFYGRGGRSKPTTKRVAIPDSVHVAAVEADKIYDFATIGEAIRHMCQEGGYDV